MDSQKIYELIYEMKKDVTKRIDSLEKEITELKNEVKELKESVSVRFDNVEASLEVLAKRNFETERDVYRLKNIAGIGK